MSKYTPNNLTYLYLLKFSKAILLIIVLNCVIFHFTGFSLFEKVLRFNWLIRLVLLLGLVSAIYLLFQRDYYLSFLGEAVYPCGSLATKIPKNANKQVFIKTKPLTNVIYWASDYNEWKGVNQVIDNPWDAYMNYENAGVAKSDINGVATLEFRNPVEYEVMGGLKKLDRHVHYRICEHPGMLGPVESVFIDN